MKEVKLGQVWKRKNGALVVVTDEREYKGLTEYELSPMTYPYDHTKNARKSWKWDGGINNDLIFVADAPHELVSTLVGNPICSPNM